MFDDLALGGDARLCALERGRRVERVPRRREVDAFEGRRHLAEEAGAAPLPRGLGARKVGVERFGGRREQRLRGGRLGGAPHARRARRRQSLRRRRRERGELGLGGGKRVGDRGGGRGGAGARQPGRGVGGVARARRARRPRGRRTRRRAARRRARAVGRRGGRRVCCSHSASPRAKRRSVGSGRIHCEPSIASGERAPGLIDGNASASGGGGGDAALRALEARAETGGRRKFVGRGARGGDGRADAPAAAGVARREGEADIAARRDMHARRWP